MKEKYKVISSTFVGYGKDGSATYKITFNKSLQHTGRLCGIEDGLNDYVKTEKRIAFVKSIPNVWNSFVRWVKVYI